MNIKRVFYLFGLFVVFSFIVVLLDNFFHLGLSSDSALNTFVTPFIIILSFIMVIPSLRKSFNDWFILDKRKVHQAICFPIIGAIFVTFLVNIYRFIPYWLGLEEVGVGANQVTNLQEMTNTGIMIGLVMIGPFNEEFLFRYLLYGGLILIFAAPAKEYKLFSRIYNHLFIVKNPKYIIGWVLSTNVIFALCHGPSLENFPLYFIPGIIDTIFFLRYGFLSAWISHGMFNLFSGITLQIVISTLIV